MFCLYKLKEVGLRIYSLSYASNEVETGVRVSRRGRGGHGLLRIVTDFFSVLEAGAAHVDSLFPLGALLGHIFLARGLPNGSRRLPGGSWRLPGGSWRLPFSAVASKNQ